jgi:hypothetical protein
VSPVQYGSHTWCASCSRGFSATSLLSIIGGRFAADAVHRESYSARTPLRTHARRAFCVCMCDVCCVRMRVLQTLRVGVCMTGAASTQKAQECGRARAHHGLMCVSRWRCGGRTVAEVGPLFRPWRPAASAAYRISRTVTVLCGTLGY